MPTYPAGPGITRFELETSRSHGFLVRIRRNGEKTSEFFADAQHGGKRKAKKLAQQRYAELCKTLGPPNTRATKNRITARNSTGKVGVHIARSVDTRWGKCEYTSYCASWIATNGERQKISFSWNKYGDEAAYELACIARKLESKDRAAIIKLHARRAARRKPAKRPSRKINRRK